MKSRSFERKDAAPDSRSGIGEIARRVLRLVVESDQPPVGHFLVTPCGGVGEEGMKQAVRHVMPRAHTAITPDYGHTGKGEIAHGIEHLMADEFVPVAQALAIENAALVHDDRVLERTAAREADLPQGFHIAQRTERARIRIIADKSIARESLDPVLFANGGIVEVDIVFDLEMLGGQ